MKKTSLLMVVALCLFAACAPSAPVKPDLEKALQEYGSVKNAKNVVDPVHGEQTRFAYGALGGINGTNANGVAVLRSFADGASVGRVNLNILPVASGQHYIVWTSDAAGATLTFRGELTSIIGDTRHSLAFETKDDVSRLAKIVVTKETSATVDSPTASIAEGTLKEAQ